MPASRQEAYVSVMSGLGIAQASTAIRNSELRSGRLLALLTDYALEPVEVHAVLPGGPRASAKVLAFTDFAAAFKAVPHASAPNAYDSQHPHLQIEHLKAADHAPQQSLPRSA